MGQATILYVGSDQGLFTIRSEDGQNWDTQGPSLRGWSVPKLDVQAAQPNRVVAGTRGDGVWVSEDFGETWGKPSYGRSGPGKVRSVAIDPEDPNTIYAGGEPIDIFVSHDAGRLWERMASVWDEPSLAAVRYPVPIVEPHVRHIVFDPRSSDTIYAAIQVGFIMKSTNGGQTWKLLDQGLDSDVHTIAVDPTNPDRVFIATGGHDARSGRVKGRALYMSTDAGESWDPTALEFEQEYSAPLAIHPDNPAVILSAVANGNPGSWRARPSGAEATLIRSDDGGEHWTGVEQGPSSTEFTDAIVFDESDPDRVYLGLRSGELYGSRDGGRSWSPLNVTVPSVSDMACVRA